MSEISHLTAATKVNFWNMKNLDTDNAFDSLIGTNYRFTPQTAGYYCYT